MAKLTETPNLAQVDDFYAALLRAHEGLSEAETHRLNARLVLVLANHIGEAEALERALEIARGPGAPPQDPTTS